MGGKKERHESGESNASGESVTNFIPTPPDGGWGWVIVASSLVCNIIVDGIGYSFGVFLSEFVTAFDEPRSKVAFVGSLLCGVYLCAGPIVSGLANKFGCRSVTIVGSIIGSIGFLLARFSTSINILILTYGVIGGFGFGMMYLPSIVSVGYYFEKKRAIATGIAVCGSGIGTFIIAPFSKYLLDEYDWKNTVMILAAIILNGVVCGALMRPLEPPKKKSKRPRNKNVIDRLKEQAKSKRTRSSQSESAKFNMKDTNLILEGVREAKLLREKQLEDESDLGSLPSTIFIKGIGRQDSLTRDARIQKLSISDKGDTISCQTGSPVGVPKMFGQDATSLTSDSTTRISTIVEGNVVETPLIVTPSTPMGSSPDSPEPITEETLLNSIEDENSNPRDRKGSKGNKDSSKSNISIANGLPKGVYAHEVLPLIETGDSRQLAAKRQMNGAKQMFMRDNKLLAVGSARDMGIHKEDYARPLYRKDIFYSGSILHIPQFKSQPDMRSYIASITTIPGEIKPDHASKLWKCCPCLPKSVKDTLQEMLDVSLLTDRRFVLICIGNVFAMVGVYVPFVYLVDRAVLLGIDKGKSAFLLAVIGITNTIGRILVGFLADLRKVDSLVINNFALIVAGISTLLFPFCNTYPLLVFNACIFGLCVAAFISLTSIIICDLLGLEKLTNAFGLLSLARGISGVLGPPLGGAVYQATNSYDATFYLAGIIFIAGALCHYALQFPCLKKEKKGIDMVFQEPEMEGDTIPPALPTELLTVEHISQKA